MNINTTTQGAVTTIEVNENVSMFVTSDIHFDSVYCNRKQFFSDLDMAIGRNALVFIIGDFFDAMNGRFDPRRSMSDLRPEYRRDDYYDFVVKDAAEKLGKYAPNIAMIAPGNHELSVLKHANTYLSDRLVATLNSKGARVQHGGYGGWLRMVIRRNERKVSVTRIKYFHGSGGEAPVTRGAIQTNRQAVFLPDADVVLNGHSHNAYWIPITRERISGKGIQYFDTQHHVRTPGYMQSYGDGTAGWEVTRGGVPKPIGGCFVFLKYTDTRPEMGNGIEIQPLIHNPVPVSAVDDLYQGIVFPQE